MKYIILFFVLITSYTTAWAGDDDIYFGMVEDVPGVYYGEGNNTKVRVLFSYKAKKWQAYKSDCEDSDCLSNITNSYPKEVTWFIGLDGRQVGKVTAKTPKKFEFYSHIGHQTIAEGDAPTIGKASNEFSGFSGKVVHRPLVAVSKPYFQDPQKWKRHQATPELTKQALAIVRKHAPALCKAGKEETSPLIPLHLTQAHLNIRSHKSTDGRLLLMVSINDAYYCDGGAGDGLYDPQMFAIDSAGKTHYLGSGLKLVDAGDYDGDGVSELVMSLSRYNRGGYVLFSNLFVEVARFEFSYH